MIRSTLALIALSTCSSSLLAQDEIDDPFFYVVEQLGWDLTEQTRTPGVAVARIKNGELAWAQGCGFADVEAEQLVTPETVFNIGSISKTVAAWGILKLVEEGRLDLDASIAKYLERWELPASEFDTEQVTLRRLLSHTAGLTLHGYPGYEPTETLPTIEESLSGESNAGGLVLYCEPGTNWKYSGGGFTIAQLMLEEQSGRDFGEYMRVEVFEPLGMLATDYRWTPEVSAAAAVPYDQSARPIGGPRFIALAAAGCQTSVLDLARFGIANLAADAESEERGAVLSPKSLALMQTLQTSSPSYGLGIAIEDLDGIRVIGHGGANKGWMAQISLAPELGDGIVILTNGSNGGRVHRPIRAAWLDQLKAERED